MYYRTHTKTYAGNMKGSVHLRELGIHRKLLWKWVLKE